MVLEVNENIKSTTIIPVIVPNFSVQLASATPIPLHYNIMILLLLRRAAYCCSNRTQSRCVQYDKLIQANRTCVCLREY